MQDEAESKMEAALDRTLKETSTRIAASAIPWVPTYTNGVLCSNSVDVFVTSSNESANSHPLMIKSPRKKRPPSETIDRLSLDSIAAILSSSSQRDDAHSLAERIEVQAKLVQYRANRRAPWSGKKHNHQVVSNNDTEPISRREIHKTNSNDASLRELQSLYGDIILGRSEQLDCSSICRMSDKNHISIKQKEQISVIQIANLDNPNIKSKEEREGKGTVSEFSYDPNQEQRYVSCGNFESSRKESENIEHIESDLKILDDQLRREMNLEISDSKYEDHSPGHRYRSNSFTHHGEEDNSSRKNYKSARTAAYYVVNVKILKPTVTPRISPTTCNVKSTLSTERHENEKESESESENNKSAARNTRIIEEIGILIIQWGATKKEILRCLLNQFPSSLSAISKLLTETNSTEMEFVPTAISDKFILPEVRITCIPVRRKIDSKNNITSDYVINALNDTLHSNIDNMNDKDSSINNRTAHSGANTASVGTNTSFRRGSNGTQRSSVKTDTISFDVISLSLKGMDYVPPLDSASEIVVSFL